MLCCLSCDAVQCLSRVKVIGDKGGAPDPDPDPNPNKYYFSTFEYCYYVLVKFVGGEGGSALSQTLMF